MDMMKAMIKPPIERVVTLEMTESEAEIIIKFFARQCQNDTQHIINKYGLNLNAAKTENIFTDMYKELNEVLKGGDK
jgi:hypothetical protein